MPNPKCKCEDGWHITPRCADCCYGGPKLSHEKQQINNLTQVPTADLYAELGRRRSAQRKTHSGGIAGRPKVLSPCPLCGQSFGVAEMRAHRPKCKSEQKQ